MKSALAILVMAVATSFGMLIAHEREISVTKASVVHLDDEMESMEGRIDARLSRIEDIGLQLLRQKVSGTQ